MVRRFGEWQGSARLAEPPSIERKPAVCRGGGRLFINACSISFAASDLLKLLNGLHPGKPRHLRRSEPVLGVPQT